MRLKAKNQSDLLTALADLKLELRRKLSALNEEAMSGEVLSYICQAIAEIDYAIELQEEKVFKGSGDVASTETD